MITMNTPRLAIFLFLTFSSIISYCQINVTVGMTPAQYVQQLLGPGVSVSNVTYTGLTGQSSGTAHSDNSGYYEFDVPLHQIGAFSNGNTSNLGLTEGLILSTGEVRDASKPASFFANSYRSSMPNNDNDLKTIGGNRPTYDISILEFDFIPLGPSINFDFVFASEEYPNWVGQNYNDAFGFFLSGPGITGPYSNGSKNIALIPTTTTPISIGTVNNGYGDCQPIFGSGGNTPPSGPCTNCTYYVNNCGGTSVAYGGFTTVLNASHAVQCGQTYHIKIAIADIKDANWDSAIFLKKNSLTSSSLSITSSISNTSQPVSICQGETVDLTVQLTGGLNNTGTYLWEHSGETTTTVSLSPTVTTDYIVTYTESGCEIIDTAQVIVASPVSFSNVNVGPCAANLYAVTGDLITTQNPPTGDLIVEDCNGIQTVIASAPFTGNTFPFNITGLTANGNNCEFTAYFSAAICTETYNFTAPAPCNGCDNVTITYTPTINATSCGISDGSISLSGAGGTAPYSYSIDNGANYQTSGAFSNLAAGSYNVSVKDNNGCTIAGIENIGNLNGPSITNSTPTNPSCFGICDGSLQVNVTGGSTPYTYEWFDNLGNPIVGNTNNLSNLCDGAYSVLVTDNSNCNTTANLVLNQPAQLNANFSGLNANYCISDGIVNLIPVQTGGNFSGPGVIGNTFNPTIAGNGNHVITYTIGSGTACVETKTITVTVNGPTADFTANPMITDVSNTTVDFNNLSSNATNYSWSFGDSSPLNTDFDPTHVFPNNTPGEYTVQLTASDNTGCTAIKILKITITALEMEYTIPNIFTPNGDASNEVFKLINSQNIVQLDVLIVNRWGNPVYSSNEVNFSWNGKINNNGTDCIEGTYFYKMKLTDMVGNTKEEHGFVQLARGK